MYGVPHEFSNDQENEDILVKSENWAHIYYCQISLVVFFEKV